jgi:hypothetical protein
MSVGGPRGLYVGTADEERQRRADRILYGEEKTTAEFWSDDRIDAYWTEEFKSRLRRDQDAVILVWGPAGSGKSSLIMDRIRKMDPTFTAETLPDRVAFKSSQIADLYSNVPRYGAFWVDEALSAGLLATDTNAGEQADLVEMINAVRALNLALFIAMPNPSDLAKSFRARRADYRIEIVRDGDGPGRPIAYVGRRPIRRKFYAEDSRWLGFIDDEKANPLRWPDLRNSDDPKARALWETYYPLKMGWLRNRLGELGEGAKLREEVGRVRGLGRGRRRRED